MKISAYTFQFQTRTKMFKKIIEVIINHFPDTEAIIIWGSSTKADFSPKFGDVDVIIVTNQKQNLSPKKIQTLLKQITEELKGLVELDPSIATKYQFKKLQLITTYNARTAHGLDQYQIKYQSRVIYGDKKVLEQIPGITFKKAVEDVLPYVRDVIIKSLKAEIEKTTDLDLLLKEKKDQFFVLARTLYTLKTDKIGTKLETLNYLGKTYPELLAIFEHLKALYQKRLSKNVLDKIMLLSLLSLTEKEINYFSSV